MLLRQLKYLLLLIGIMMLGSLKPILAQSYAVQLHKDSLPKDLRGSWKFNASDDPSFALPVYNDSTWKDINSFLPVDEIGDSLFKGFGWFRIHISLPASLKNRSISLDVLQNGASEIFVDGRQVATYGKVSVNGTGEQRFDPYGVVLPVLFNNDSIHVIAVRYSNHKYEQDIKWEEWNAGFRLSLDLYADQTFQTISSLTSLNLVLLTVSGFLAALTLVHFFFFIFYRKQKHHLYYSIFTFFFSLFFFLPYFSFNTFNPDITAPLGYFIPVVIPIYLISLAGFIYYLILDKLPRFFWINILLGLIIISGFFFKTGYNDIFYALLICVVITQSFTAVGRGKAAKKEGINIIMWGLITFFSLVGLIGIVYIIEILGISIGNFYISSGTSVFIVVPIIFILLSIPISISLYMAKSFAVLNVSLEKKLKEVEELSAKNIEQEKEKQEILVNQNLILDQQVKERTKEILAQRDEIEHQKELVEEQKKEMVDSITYAKRIQDAILPPIELIREKLPGSFILYKPKDIVAGDFYWMEEKDGTVFIAAADCTGHGVPGALVSVVCSNALNRAVKEFGLNDTGKILDKVTDLVLETFEKSMTDVKDGMDISLLSINKKTRKINWSGANNPLWYFDNAKLTEITADKQPIGKSDHLKPFTTHIIEYKEGAVFYLFTDGYADQFGGPKGKKYKYKQFQETLLMILNDEPALQLTILDQAFENWKGELGQVDDVCVIGIRLN